MAKLNIAGHACSDGLTLYTRGRSVRADCRTFIAGHVRYYVDDDLPPDQKRRPFVFWVRINTLVYIVLLIIFELAGNDPVRQLIDRSLVPCFLDLCALVFFVDLMARDKSCQQWHAAEHMVINAYERGLELTLEAVRCCPRSHARCGSTLMLMPLHILIVYAVTLSSLWAALLGVLIWYGSCKLAQASRRSLWLVSLLQYAVYTRRPGDFQLKAAIETMKRLIREAETEK